MASGLPVIGLDAEGTRDLVTNEKTGYLLPQPPCDWSTACQRSSPHFRQLATHYAQLLAKACGSHGEREEMGRRASTEGIKGYTWWDAMEVCPLPVRFCLFADEQRCVDGYRESLGISRSRRLELQAQRAKNTVSVPSSPKISRVNRVVSKRLLPKAKTETREGIWHLSKSSLVCSIFSSSWAENLLKLLVVLMVSWAVYSRHSHSKTLIGVDVSN
jgi:hypothetical protein